MARKTSFYYSFLVLPADQRRAIIAVWDFCRAVDDAVDEDEHEAAAGGPPEARGPAKSGHDVLAARDAVEFWREELARCYGAGVPRTREGRQLQPSIEAFELPREPFEDVIDGVAMDLDTMRYQTMPELLEYCRRVASAVGMICIRIFGCRHEGSREYAWHLGVALQLTNILRDIKSDLERGRVYLPLEDLAAAGCRIEDLAAGRMTAPVRRLIELECGRAREFYQRAVDARPAEDRRRLLAAEIMRAVYFETLTRIERGGYDVFTTRVRVPKPRQALIAMRHWLWQT